MNKNYYIKEIRDLSKNYDSDDDAETDDDRLEFNLSDLELV